MDGTEITYAVAQFCLIFGQFWGKRILNNGPLGLPASPGLRNLMNFTSPICFIIPIILFFVGFFEFSWWVPVLWTLLVPLVGGFFSSAMTSIAQPIVLHFLFTVIGSISAFLFVFQIL
jgi:hypothetical protein